MNRAIVSLAVLAASGVARAQAPSEAESLALDASHGIAPQPPRVSDLYRRARPLERAPFVGLWVCEASVTGDDWDGADPNGPVRRYMGRVELDADVRLPQRDDLVRFQGPDDTNRVVFAVAGVDVRAGDHVLVDLTDRDMLSSDPIARFDLVFDGTMPIRASAERASLECRGVPLEAIADRIDDAIDDADDALEDLERDSRPDRSLVGFRDQDADPSEAALAIYDIARYAGLADPRFLARRDVLRSREAGFLANTAALVQDLRAEAAPVGAALALPGGSVELIVDELDCAVEDVIGLHAELGLDTPMECALRLTFRNRGGATTLGATFHVVDDLGLTLPITRFGVVSASGLARVRSLRLPSGDTSVVFACPSRRALLLRSSARRRETVWSNLVATTPPRSTTPASPRPGRDRADPNDPIDAM